MNESFFKDKRVLLTGHTGFKGGWLGLWLETLGAEVLGYALSPQTSPSFFDIVGMSYKSVIGDILDVKKLNLVFSEFEPQIVFHLAAQPLVRRSYSEPVLTYQTNVIGTLNVLEAARKSKSVKSFVNITTDKVYENKERGRFFEESDPFGGHDPYSASKACVEIMSESYRRSFLKGGFRMATVRAGNVIGGGDFSADRLLPDCIRAFERGEKVVLRNPKSVRPWQHVLEPLGGYLNLAEKLFEDERFATAYNFGPPHESVLSVEEIARLTAECYGSGEVEIQDETAQLANPHEANLLMLDISKARRELGFVPVFSAKDAVERSVAWYKAFANGEDMRKFSLEQICEFVELQKNKRLKTNDK